MRVASKTIYDTVKFNLGTITENLYKANRVVATGKRITGLSDDPVGLTQVLNIKSTLSNIEQLGRNIDLGKSWLIASESALSHVQNMISEARVLCVQMTTGTMGEAQRASAAETVQNRLEEIVSLANTEVSGRYIFAGFETSTAPFTLALANNDVTYNGDNNAFTVKIDRDATVQAGSDGEAVFLDETVTIDTTNNKIDFEEVATITIAAGSNDIIDYKENDTTTYAATLTAGIYTCSDMATEIETQLEAAGNADYTVAYDSDTNKFTITKGAGELDILWNSGVNASQSPKALLGYADEDDTGLLSYSSDQTLISDELTATIDSGNWTSAELCTKIENALETATVNSADYTVSYDDGTDKFTILSASGLTELKLLWNTGTNKGTSVASDLGFDAVDEEGDTSHTSDNEVKWGIFGTFIDLRDYLETNDVSGIGRSINRLSYHLDHISTKISDIGSKMIRMEIKTNIFQDLNLANTDRLSNIEDADITEAIMDLKEKELAYKSALASSARVMELSLIDYL